MNILMTRLTTGGYAGIVDIERRAEEMPYVKWPDVVQKQVEEFVRDRLTPDRHGRLTSAELYEEYQRYAEKNEHFPLTLHSFGRHISNCITKSRTSERVIYLGYALTAQPSVD